MSFLSEIFRRKPKASPLVRIQGDGQFSLEVVGESHYQKELDKLVGGKTEEGHTAEFEAILLHDNQNPHDPMAVAVSIDGEIVGYLDRKMAREHREQMVEAGFPGSPAICGAIVVGGWKRSNNSEGSYGVRLDVPTT